MGECVLSLDHIAVLGETLKDATDHVRAALGRAPGPGGQHALFGTHNRLLALDPGLYLEAIATDPGAPPPGRPRWFGLDRFGGAPRLDKWICRVPDLDAARAAFPEAGEVVELARGDLTWRMAVPGDGQLPFDGLFPALIEWQSPATPADSLPSSGCRLVALDILHPQAKALQKRLAPCLDAPLLRFVTAGAPAMRAHLYTPDGRRVLQ